MLNDGGQDMSDYLVKIIPVEPENKITMEAAEAITKRIHESIKSDTVEFKSEGTPFFVDCGSNLDEIKCPICGVDKTLFKKQG